MEMETNLTKGYIDAYKLACVELAKRNINEICVNANVALNTNEDAFNVKYLDRVYQVSCMTGNVIRADHNEEVSVTLKVLLLHYLLNARDLPLSGNLVSFKDLRGGAAIYYNTFYKRAITPLIKTFGNCAQDMYFPAEKLDGRRAKYGHASIMLSILPRIPVTYVVWEGDEEIPASGTILFDDTIESHLPAEDIVYAGSFGVYELMRLKQV
jgi:hypothetical protein